MDNNFNKQWTFQGGVLGNFTGFSDIEITDGKYIACGNYSNALAWVVKLDADGHVIWEGKYKGLQDTTATWNLLTDIDVLPDGGLVAVGQCQRIVNPNNLLPQLGWFLKLDSNGCEIENCTVGINELRPEPVVASSIKLYPNPGQNSITIEYSGVNENSKLYIIDVLGVMIETKTLTDESGKLNINTSNYQNGIYLARIEADRKSLAKSKFIIQK